MLIAPAVSGQPDPEELDPQMQRGMAAWTEASADPEALLRFETQWWLDGPEGPEGRVGGDARELALDMNRPDHRQRGARGRGRTPASTRGRGSATSTCR